MRGVVTSAAGVAELTSDTAAFGLHDARIFESYGDMPTEASRSTLVVETGPGDWTVPDLSMWRPWAGSLFEAPTHPQIL